MIKLTVLLGLVCSLFLSCSKELDGKVLIRVNNQSGKHLDDVSVFSLLSDGHTQTEKRYGSVSPGSATNYQSHARAYDFPLFKFMMSGIGSFEIRDPRCPFGLGELAPGKYSLLIWEDNSQPNFRLVKD